MVKTYSGNNFGNLQVKFYNDTTFIFTFGLDDKIYVVDNNGTEILIKNGKDPILLINSDKKLYL